MTLALQANVAVMHTLKSQITVLEERLQERVRLHEDYALLTTVPGIGQTLATTIMLETGSIARFAKVGDFSSYCRCVDSLRESNGKKKGEGNAKNGNQYLAWAFVGSGALFGALLPASQALLRAQEAAAEWDRGH